MSKVMKQQQQLTNQRSASTQHGYYRMRSSQTMITRKNMAFNRSISLSEVQSQFGLSEDSEEDKSEALELDNEEDLFTDSLSRMNSDFEDDEDDEDEDDYGRGDVFQRQLGYPPLPKYKTPTPANPFDKLGTLTPMEEMTEPPESSGANSPVSFTHQPSSKPKLRGSTQSQLTNDSENGRSNDLSNRSQSRNGSSINLTVSHDDQIHSNQNSASQKREPPSSSPTRQGGGQSDLSPSRSHSPKHQGNGTNSDFPPSIVSHDHDFPSESIRSSSHQDFGHIDSSRISHSMSHGDKNLHQDFGRIDSSRISHSMSLGDKNNSNSHSSTSARHRSLSPPDSLSSLSGEDRKEDENREQVKSNSLRSSNKNGYRSPHRVPTPHPHVEDEIDFDVHNMGGDGSHTDFTTNFSSSPLSKERDLSDVEKIASFDRVRSWQRHAAGSAGPVYSAIADAEFSAALDGMIMKLHGSKVDWEHRVKLADDLTASLKNVSPQVLLKNLSQIIPLVSNIAAESHFRVSLSILNTITMLGDRLRDCKALLGTKSIQNADLTWLIRRLCTVCGESRSTLRTEGALALSHLIKGAGPELVCGPLYSILSSESKKSSSSAGRLTAGPRIKAAAIDALTFALLTFPRDEFELPVLAKYVCKSLWNTKRRVRQASLECLAVVAHALGPAVALPMFRQFIEQTKIELTSSSSSSGGGTVKRCTTNYASVATPSGAISARVSRHLLPSPSPAGLVEYAVLIPLRTMQQSSYDNNKGNGKSTVLDPVLNGSGSGKNRHSAMIGADIAWIMTGTGPIVNTTLYSPSQNLEWLTEESGTGGCWPPSEGESSSLHKSSSERHFTKSKMKNSHSYNGTMDLLDTPMKPLWGSSLSNPSSGFTGAYMDRYHKSSSNGFLADVHGKSDKVGRLEGFSILPNKYPNHGSSNELPNLTCAAFGDFNSNLWSQHDEFMGFNNNNHPNNKGYSIANSKSNNKHSRPMQPMSISQYSNKCTDSSSRFDLSQNNTSIDQSDSDQEPYVSRRSSQQYGSGGSGEGGTFIKINREYDETDDGKKDGGLDSAGSSNTRDSGVSLESSLKSSKTIPSPPSIAPPYEARSNIPKMTLKKKPPSPSSTSNIQRSGENHLSNSRSWSSTPDVPELSKTEDDSRKNNDFGSDISRSQSGSSGFLHRKPVLARASQPRKTSSESIQNRLSALELRDFDDGTESETTYSKEITSNPLSYHMSLSANNIANNSEDEVDKMQPAYYSTSSLRRPTNNMKQPARSPLRTPGGGLSGLSSHKGDAASGASESCPPKNNLSLKKTVPKRVYKGSYRDSMRNVPTVVEVFPADLKPVDSPRHALSLALNNLNSSEWEINLDGFRLLVRLSRHHPDSLRTDLHNICINGMRHLMNLRSQVCRSACLFFKELFLSQGKLMEQDVEKISEKLLDKSSDTNKFIREDSGSAIEALVLNLSPAKILTCLDTYGLKHRNPIVRTTASRMLTLLVRRLGAERSLFDHPDKILPMVMHFLQEGSLETRTHAKAAIAEMISHQGFDSQLRRHVPAETLRNVSKSIGAIRTEMH